MLNLLEKGLRCSMSQYNGHTYSSLESGWLMRLQVISVLFSLFFPYSIDTQICSLIDSSTRLPGQQILMRITDISIFHCFVFIRKKLNICSDAPLLLLLNS